MTILAVFEGFTAYCNTSLCSADLLGLSFDDAVAVPTEKQPPQSQLEPTLPTMPPTVPSDVLSLLEPASTVPEVSVTEGSLALSLLETPLTSLRVPEEYSQLPPLPGWENKVGLDTTS